MTIEQIFNGARRWVRSLGSNQEETGEFVVDMFAGGGGTSCGLKGALGRDPEVAMNHDPHAIAIHELNHPGTHHFTCDIREVNPREVMPERPIGLLWLSPDCTHHSRAKGGKPAKRNRRALANVGTVWAAARKPRVIILENVEEFEGWGPLDDQGQPDKTKKGQSFKRWVGKLKRLGYEVQWKSLVAADFGAPTIRKRLFLIARCDGKKIVWPAATHAPASKATLLGLKPWRAAYECIDWSIPARSIFERKKPLAEATMRRIHAGIFKFVFGGDPFIVTPGHSGSGFRGQSVREPMSTITASRDMGAVVSPVFSGVGGRAGCSPSRTLKAPMKTLTAKADDGLVLPFLSPYYNPNGEGNVRAHDLREPQPTIPSRNNTHALASAHIVGTDQTGEFRPRSSGIDDPVPTLTSSNHHALVEHFLVKFKGKQGPKDIRKPLDGMTTKPSDAMGAAYLVKNNTGSHARDLKDPVATLTTTQHDFLTQAKLKAKSAVLYCPSCKETFVDKYAGEPGPMCEPECPRCGDEKKIEVVAPKKATAWLQKNFTGVIGSDLRQPKGTITSKDHDSLIAATLDTMRGTSQAGRDIKEPMPGLTAGGLHVGAVTAFLVKYFRTGVPRSVRRPAPTLTAKQRLGLVQVQGIEYQISDICLRMLTPMELLRAQFGKYAEGYKLIGNQEKQVKAIGNSVPPEVAEALVRANVVLRVSA